MAIELKPYDTADYLKTEGEVAAYLDEAFKGGELSMIMHALGVAGRARGMSRLARAAGVQREGLYRSLSASGNPEIGTVLKVAKAMGFRLSIEPIAKRSARRKKAA